MDSTALLFGWVFIIIVIGYCVILDWIDSHYNDEKD